MAIQKIKFKHTYWVLFYLVIFSFLLFNSFNYLDPDLGWHLRVGENILTDAAVPGLDHYNYTLEGQRWIDHEWLFDIITFLIYNNFGYIILSLFFALIFFLTLISLHIFTYLNFTNKNNPLFLFSFFILFGAITLAPHSGIRAQEIAMFNFLLILFILFYYSKNKNLKFLFILPPLFFLWANLHASFILGIFLLFFFLFIKSIEIFLKKIDFFNFLSFRYLLNKKELIIYSIFAFSSFLATLFTPYGLKIINLFNRIHVSGAFHLKTILEWLPAYKLPINYYQLVYGAIASAILILFLIFSIADRKKHKAIKTDKNKIDLWLYALSFIFLLLAFKSKRHFPFFFIASFPLIINFSSSFFKLNNKKIKYYICNNYLLNIFIILIFLLTSAFLTIKTNYTNRPFLSKKYCATLPCRGVNFLKNNREYKDLKLFAEYGWGGYLIWNWPEKKLFIDGRLPQYPFAGHTLLAEYYDFFKEESVEKKLTGYNIKAIMINKPKKVDLNWFDKYILGIDENNLVDIKKYFRNYLNNTSTWQMAYEDNACIIYIKNE